jgi:acyl carrier protein
MKNNLIHEVKEIICNTVRTGIQADNMPDDFRLIGNILDSMAVTNLILALEEHFGFSFEDDELSAEAFETVASLAALVQHKRDTCHA